MLQIEKSSSPLVLRQEPPKPTVARTMVIAGREPVIPTKAVEVIPEQKIPQDMGLLSSIVKKIAPDIIKNTMIGGDKDDREALAEHVTDEVFEPVYEKFGNSVETIVKIGGGVALATIPGLKDALSKTSGPMSSYNQTPGITGPLENSTTGAASSSLPGWVLPVAVILGLVLMFGKKLLR